MTIRGIEKVDNLPDGVVPVEDFKWMWELVPGKKKWTKENVRLKMGVTYYVTDHENVFRRQTHPLTDKVELNRLVNLGVVYISPGDKTYITE